MVVGGGKVIVDAEAFTERVEEAENHNAVLTGAVGA